VARRINEALGITEKILEKPGVFNGFVDLDSELYIDPNLLKAAKTPELARSYEKFLKYFDDVVRLLDASKAVGDRFFAAAWKRLIFHEEEISALGYAKRGIAGSGIGEGLALNIAGTAAQIVAAGIKDPEIFQLVGVLEGGIGADRISDMTISIILPDLLAYSERIAQDLELASKKVVARGKAYRLPYDSKTGKPIMLIPREILDDLPVALNWYDIDIVCKHNKELRAKVNEIIGRTWKDATRKITKKELKETLLKYPGALRDMVEQYEEKEGKPYDFGADPSGILSWQNIARKFAEKFPLRMAKKPKSAEDVLRIVKTICEQFQELVEGNGLFRVFYDDSGKLRHERFAQLLFFGVADSYCSANNLDLNREPNAGRGPVDFKVSRGYAARVTVEVKYSSNTSLQKGYTKQLPIYNRAERTVRSIFLIIRTTASQVSIKNLLQVHHMTDKERT